MINTFDAQKLVLSPKIARYFFNLQNVFCNKLILLLVNIFLTEENI